MKLKKIIKLIIKEEAYVQKPKIDPKFRNDDPLSGYTTKQTDFDPETGKRTWEVNPEPQLLRYAKEVGRMRRELSYFDHLPDSDEFYKGLKSQSVSIRASLQNAEGKLRQLYKDLQIIRKFKDPNK